jgi:hypothetical protein
MSEQFSDKFEPKKRVSAAQAPEIYALRSQKLMFATGKSGFLSPFTIGPE